MHGSSKPSRRLTALMLAALVALLLPATLALGAEVGTDDYRVSDMAGIGNTAGRARTASTAYNSAAQEYLVVWSGTESDATTTQDRIYGQRVNARTGVEVGSDYLVSEMPGTNAIFDAQFPKVVYNSVADEYFVVFVGNPNSTATETDVFGQRLASDGSRIGAAAQISSCGSPGDANADVGGAIDSPIGVAFNAASNQYLVALRCDDVGDNGAVNNEFEIYGRLVNADGTPVGSNDFQISQTEGANGNSLYTAEAPSVTWNSAANQYLVVFGADTSATGDGSREIYGQLLSAAGTEIGANDFPISNTPVATRDSSTAEVAYNPITGQYLVVWGSDRLVDDVVQVHGQFVTAAGTPTGTDDFQIGANATDTTNPNVEIVYNSIDDEFLVSWARGGGTAAEVTVQRVDANSVQLGTNDQIVSNMANSLEGPTGLAYNSRANSYIAAWAGSDDQGGQISGENEIFAQILSEPVDMRVTKTVSVSQAVPGESLSYTITYLNAGPNRITDVVLTDSIPALLSGVSFSASGVTGSPPVARGGAPYVWDIDQLLPGQGGTITVVGTVVAAATNGTVVNNTASITSTSPHLDSNTADNSASAAFTVVEPVLNVTTTLLTSAAGVDAGDTVRYQIQVAHDATSASGAYAVNLSDSLPAALQGVTLQSAIVSDGASSTNVAGAFTLSGNTLSTAGTVNLLLNTNGSNDQRLTVTVAGTVRDTIAPSALISNSASATWRNSAALQKPSYAAAAAAPTITVPGVLSVAKSITAPGSQARIGETVTYQLSVGLIEGTTSDLELVDTLPAGMAYVSGSSMITPSGMTIATVIVTRSGQTLTFRTASATNPGNVDNAPAVDTDSFTISYQAVVANVAGNQRGTALTNDVDATATGVPPDNNNQATVTVAEPELTVSKAADDTTPTPGQAVNFNITVSHQAGSNATAHEVQIADTVPAGMTLDPGSVSVTLLGGATGAADTSGGDTVSVAVDQIPVGGSAVVSYQATVAARPAVSIGDVLTNSVVATWTSLDGVAGGERTGAGGVDDHRATASRPVTVSSVDLTLAKSDGGASVAPGGTVAYTLSYANTGNQGATGVTLTETVPANTTFNAGASTAGWSCAPNNGAGSTCTLAVGAMAAGASGSATFAVTAVNPVAAGVGQISNTASVADDGTNGADLNPGDNSASDTTTLNAAPDLTLTKSDGGVSVAPGGTVAYTLSYANTGNQGATGVALTEIVPANTSFNAGASTAGWSCAPNNGAGSTCTLAVGAMAAGASSSATFAVTAVNPVAAGVGQISNTASLADDGTNGADPTPGNNSASDTTTLNAAPDLTLTKSDGGAAVAPGGTVAYTLSYTNTGNQGATGVALTETVPANTSFNAGASTAGWSCAPNNGAGSTCTLAVGAMAAGASGSATFAATAASPLGAGVSQISNTASLADDGTNGADPTPGNNSANDSTPIDRPPTVTVNQAAGQADPTSGGTISFTAVFNEPIDAATLTGGDVTIGGTAGATTAAVSEAAPNDGTTFTIAVSGMTGDGTVTAILGAGAASDLTGNPSEASTSTDNSVTYDASAPTVVSITRTDASPTNAVSVRWTVTFSEGVTGVAASNFTLAANGVSGATITTITGSGATRTVTASGILGDGTIGLDLTSGAGIIDAIGNGLTGAPYTGQVYVIDQTPPPAPVVVTPANGSVTTDSTPAASGTAEPATTVTVFIDGTSAGSATTDASGSWAFTPVTPLADGLHSVRARAADAAGNSSVDSNTNSFRVDTAAPTTTIDGGPAATTSSTLATLTFTGSDGAGSGVASFECRLGGGTFDACSSPLSLTGLADGSYTFEVRAIDAAGNPDPTPASYTWVVDTAAPDTTITSSPPANSTSASASFSFTGSDGAGSGVASFACQLDGAGFSACTSAQTYTGLSQGSHTFEVRATDAAGNADATPASYTWVVDTIAPTVTSITRDAASPTNAASVSWSVTFSEPVSGVGAGSFSLAPTGPSGASISAVTGSGASWTVTASTGTGDGTLGLSLTSGAGIADVAGNGLAGLPAAGPAYTIDKTAPTVTVEQAAAQADPASSAPLRFVATFSEPVGGLTDADVSLGGTAPAGTVSVSEIAPSDGTTYEISVTPGGDGTVVPSLAAGAAADPAGNDSAASTSADNSVLLDAAAPAVVSIVRAGASPTNAASVDFTVTFSEDVTGVAASNFALTTSGVSGASVGAVSGGGASWTVTVGTGTGDGTVRLDLGSSAGISDVAAKALSNAPFTGGETYAVDKTAPAVTVEQAAGQADPAGASPINFTVTFSEAVKGLGDAAVTLGGTAGATTATVSEVAPSDGTTYNVAVSGMSGPGTVTASVAAGAVSDAAGNANTASTSADNTVSFDPVVPVVTGVERAGASPTSAASVVFTVTFSKAVSGVDAADFALSTAGVSGASVSGVSGSGATRAVTVSTGAGSGTIRLDVVDDDSVVDAAGNPLGGASSGNGGFTAGQSYTIDKAGPTAGGLVAPPVTSAGATSYTFSLTYSDSTAVSAASLGAGDIRVTGPGGFSQLAAFVGASPAGDGSPVTATYRLTPPDGAWDRGDNGTYALALVGGAVLDSLGNPAPAAALGEFVVDVAPEVPPRQWRVHLPLLRAPSTPPDLVVESIAASGGQISVTIRNVGGTTVAQPFWVDLYVGPRAAPTGVNQTWPTLGEHGAAWGVTVGALPLGPGERLTLTLGGAGYRRDLSRLPATIPAGTTLYAQVDSANSETTYGAVLEGHEAAGQAYNNVTSSVTAAPLTPPAMRGGAPAGDGELPAR